VHALFVGQSVFGAKMALANGGVPVSRATEFAANMEECLRALLPSLDDAQQKDTPAFTLWVFHPILIGEDENTSKLKLTEEDRHAWWRALTPLAISIVREGPSREIHSLLRCLKKSPLLQRLDATDVIELVAPMCKRTEALTPESMGFYWDDAISCASSVIESVMARAIDVPARDQLYQFVATWAAPPLAIESAGAAAKRLRA
jgi:hypothetical protein